MASPSALLDSIRGTGILAPMLAVADGPFRALCHDHGASLSFTEMVSARGIAEGDTTAFRHAAFGDDEGPMGIQLLVNSPEWLGAAIPELERFRPSVIDINSGCPSDRVCEAGAGAELLDDIPLLRSIIETAVRVATVPVSVKLRIQGLRGTQTLREILSVVEGSGVAFLSLHGRARTTSYDEPANWDAIAEAVSLCRVPVIGNGDVMSAADALRMMERTGCHAVMVGRGSLGTPWIFDRIRAREWSEDPGAPLEEVARVSMAHLRTLASRFGPVLAVPRMRKHALWYFRFFEGVEDLKNQLFRKESDRWVLECVAAHCAREPRRLARDAEEFTEREQRFHRRVLYWIDQTDERYKGLIHSR